MHAPEYVHPRPTYFTVSVDSAGDKHYAEHDANTTAPLKCWTVTADGKRKVTWLTHPIVKTIEDNEVLDL